MFIEQSGEGSDNSKAHELLEKTDKEYTSTAALKALSNFVDDDGTQHFDFNQNDPWLKDGGSLLDSTDQKNVFSVFNRLSRGDGESRIGDTVVDGCPHW